MSTSFWCSSCKKDHPGDCPPSPSPPDASFPNRAVTPWARDMDPPLGNPGGGFIPPSQAYGGGFGVSSPSAHIDFDDLVQAYGQLDEDELKMHYNAASEALMRKLGAAPGPPPAP